jgi:acetyl esterase/lipase
MQKTFLELYGTAPWSVVHPFNAEDRAPMAAIRAAVEPMKGTLRGTAARVPFDGIMEHVAAAEGVTYEADEVGGVVGLWCRPEGAQPERVVMHLHGGWFNWGSAKAYRHFAGQIAVRAGAAVFVPDYRLAPEDPFPASADDALAAYRGLVERGFTKIVITGDSAGGNLSLGLLVQLAASGEDGSKALVGGVALSPVTNLALSGDSWTTRAAADPVFTKEQVAGLVGAYLAEQRGDDPSASPVYANLRGLAPVRVHVGDDEVLLDDSVRFVERAVAAGADARLEVWEGMLHGFLGSVGRLKASNEALKLVGEFLRERFAE